MAGVAALSLPTTGWRRGRIWRPNVRVAVGAGLLAALVAACLAAPLLSSYDPLATDVALQNAVPGTPAHPLGTDSLGRDFLARTLYGGRISLGIGVLATAISLAFGIAVGVVAGVGPSWLDTALMRIVDTLLTLPLIVVILALQAVTQPGLTVVVVAIGLTSWMSISRIVRAQILTLKELGYVRAAVTLGTPTWRIALRHILPAALPPVLAVGAAQVGHAITTESMLSFLGLGVPPTIPTWGNMLTSAQTQLLTGQWWNLAWPGGAIVLTILSINLLTDGVRLRKVAGTGTR